MKNNIKYIVLPGLALALLSAGVASAQTTTNIDSSTATHMTTAAASTFKVGKPIHGGGFMMYAEAGDPEKFAEQQSKIFTEQAEVTGISVSEIKQAWAEGKELPELLEEKGINMETVRAKMQAKAEEKRKAQIQSLVDAGVITQAQAEIRLEFMKKHTGEVREMKPDMVQKIERRTKMLPESETSTNS